MSETIGLLVVSVRPNHPSGKRNRAGFTFTTEPTAYEVTEEQEKQIREDQFLRIIERGTALDDAMSAYYRNGGKIGAKKTANAPKTSDPAPSADQNTPPASNTPDAEGNKEGKKTEDIPPAAGDNLTPAEKTAKPIARMSKEELIAGLEAKGLKAGTDFQPEATNKNLAALLSSL